jgi:hypothetical protein
MLNIFTNPIGLNAFRQCVNGVFGSRLPRLCMIDASADDAEVVIPNNSLLLLWLAPDKLSPLN